MSGPLSKALVTFSLPQQGILHVPDGELWLGYSVTLPCAHPAHSALPTRQGSLSPGQTLSAFPMVTKATSGTPVSKQPQKP